MAATLTTIIKDLALIALLIDFLCDKAKEKEGILHPHFEDEGEIVTPY